MNIAGDLAPAFQLRCYAWSAKLPLSILTDFEELAIYDCRYEPVKNDKPATARLEFITFDQYADRWDDIVALFSRDAVLDGSLEKYADANRKKRGTETVDAAFLREIEGWRDALARDLATRNDLNTRQLNYAVQMTIDRLIFLRMAEDRGIEEYGNLLGLTNGTGVYDRLVQQFRDADDRYNSGLFHFRNERGRGGEPDDLTPSLKIDDGVLGGIVRGLYYPESPYEFSVLPIDVLGQVYEQFLGSVILIVASTDDTLIVDQLLHTVKPVHESTDYRFLAGLLGSTLISYYFRKRFNRTEKTFPEIRVGELSQLPIRTIDFSDPNDVERHERMVGLVERMLELHEKLAEAKIERERTVIGHQISATDKQIDNLVYELYSLTNEEIKIVEEATAR